jgi:hypothetical protein
VYGAIAFLGPIWNVVLTSYQIAVTPDELRGRVGSVIRLVTSSVIPLGAAAAGILLQATGAVTTVVAMSVWMLTLAVTATWSPDIKRGVAAAA